MENIFFKLVRRLETSVHFIALKSSQVYLLREKGKEKTLEHMEETTSFWHLISFFLKNDSSFSS